MESILVNYNLEQITNSQSSENSPTKFALVLTVGSHSVWENVLNTSICCFVNGKNIHLTLACVASISVGLSAGLKHFSLFECAKIGVSAKKAPSVLLARPNFCATKKQKMP